MEHSDSIIWQDDLIAVIGKEDGHCYAIKKDCIGLGMHNKTPKYFCRNGDIRPVACGPLDTDLYTDPESAHYATLDDFLAAYRYSKYCKYEWKLDGAL